jgi:hypothetical protein
MRLDKICVARRRTCDKEIHLPRLAMRTVRDVHQNESLSTVNLLLHLLDHAIGDLQRKNGLKWATGRDGIDHFIQPSHEHCDDRSWQRRWEHEHLFSKVLLWKPFLVGAQPLT